MFVIHSKAQQMLAPPPPPPFHSVLSPNSCVGGDIKEAVSGIPGWETWGLLGRYRVWLTSVLGFQASMESPGPGISLALSPTGLARKLMRRATLVPARREHQKVSFAGLHPPECCAAAPPGPL